VAALCADLAAALVEHETLDAEAVKRIVERTLVPVPLDGREPSGEAMSAQPSPAQLAPA
jgi:hypothetical protein